MRYCYNGEACDLMHRTVFCRGRQQLCLDLWCCYNSFIGLAAWEMRQTMQESGGKDNKPCGVSGHWLRFVDCLFEVTCRGTAICKIPRGFVI